jgi:hypothetical protein
MLATTPQAAFSELEDCGMLFVSERRAPVLQFALQFAYVRRHPLKSIQARDLRQRTSEDGQRIRAADS